VQYVKTVRPSLPPLSETFFAMPPSQSVFNSANRFLSPRAFPQSSSHFFNCCIHDLASSLVCPVPFPLIYFFSSLPLAQSHSSEPAASPRKEAKRPQIPTPSLCPQLCGKYAPSPPNSPEIRRAAPLPCRLSLFCPCFPTLCFFFIPSACLILFDPLSYPFSFLHVTIGDVVLLPFFLSRKRQGPNSSFYLSVF